MNIIEYMEDPYRFGRVFKDLSSWSNWMVFLKVLYAIPLDENELGVYQYFTGRTNPPSEPFEEAWICSGRRSGKSTIASVIATFEALQGGWKERLPGGDTPYVFCLANDKDQAKLIWDYIRHLFQTMAREQIKREVPGQLDLVNGVSITVRAGSLRSLRGYTLALAIIDECAFFYQEEGRYANPLEEIVTALEPALIPPKGKLPGAKVIGLSTPYTRSGLLWTKVQEHLKNPDSSDFLVWKSSTMDMNPEFSQRKIDRAIAKNDKARAEYLGEFREDVSTLLDPALLESAMGGKDNRHLPLMFDPAKRYYAFLDPSSGRQDSFTMSLGFQDAYSQQIVVARYEERTAPCDVTKVVEEYAAILKAYGLHRATSDRHAAGWVESAFKKHGIQIDFTSKTKSELYLEFGGLLATGRLWVPFSERLRQQFLGLERRLEKSGLERVDHCPYSGPGDDVANAVAGLVTLISEETKGRTLEEYEKIMPVTQHMSPEGRRRESAEAMEKEMREWREKGLGKLSRIVKR